MLLTWLYIVCTLIRHVLLIRSGHTELLIRSGYAAILFAASIVTSLPLTLYRSRSCADVLRGERADVTDFFLFSWPWWMGSVVKHNMLKGRNISVVGGYICVCVCLCVCVCVCIYIYIYTHIYSQNWNTSHFLFCILSRSRCKRLEKFAVFTFNVPESDANVLKTEVGSS